MKLTFLGKKPEVAGVYTFTFKPAEPLSWVAGQSIKLELPAGYGTEERRFTISSAPYEQNVTITTRASDSRFKKTLDGLVPGTEIDAYNIDGVFAWPQTTTTPLIFCASGMGITPYYSMLKQRQHSQQPLDATLLYAWRGADMLFSNELQQIQHNHPELRIVFLPNQRISTQIIRENCPGFVQSMVYVSGPSSMVDELGDELIRAGLPSTALTRDWFTGRPGWEEQSAIL